MVKVFGQLLDDESFVDVTLACEGQSIKAHKLVLSACSVYFKELFVANPCKHPIVILKDMRLEDLRAIINFMYCGEVNVSQNQLGALLKTAEVLKVKGLTEVNDRQSETPQSNQNSVNENTPSQASTVPASTRNKKRRRKGTQRSVKSGESDNESSKSESSENEASLKKTKEVNADFTTPKITRETKNSFSESGLPKSANVETPNVIQTRRTRQQSLQQLQNSESEAGQDDTEELNNGNVSSSVLPF